MSGGHVVVDLDDARRRRQASCGHSIVHRLDGYLKCSWCGAHLDVDDELGEPA